VPKMIRALRREPQPKQREIADKLASCDRSRTDEMYSGGICPISAS
jgi:hypothetical protein